MSIKVLVAVLLAFSINARAEIDKPSCQDQVVSRGLASQLRKSIVAANRIDREANRYSARVSNFIEGRAVEIDSSKVVGSDVVSLGSGPDIFLPLYLYPRAKYFHLVDLLTKWGSGPEHVKEEIEARLKNLPFKPTVECMETAEGLSWRVRWRASQQWSQEKIFYLHEMNFNEPGNLEKLVASFGPAGLGGIVITGISASLEVRKFLLERLHQGGSMFTEMLYTNLDGQLFDEQDDQKILNDLKKDYVITDFGKSEVGYTFTPSRIVITKKGE